MLKYEKCQNVNFSIHSQQQYAMKNAPIKALFLVMGSAPNISSLGSWSDREMAAGSKLTGISIKKGYSPNTIGLGLARLGLSIAQIRAR